MVCLWLKDLCQYYLSNISSDSMDRSGIVILNKTLPLPRVECFIFVNIIYVLRYEAILPCLGLY